MAIFSAPACGEQPIVAVGVGGKGVFVGVFVRVGVAVSVGVFVGVGVAVLVGVAVGGTGVFVAVRVGVSVGSTGVGVRVRVGLGVCVAVGITGVSLGTRSVGVSVGGRGVLVAWRGVLVAGSDVLVAGATVSVGVTGGAEVFVGGATVLVGGCGVLVDWRGVFVDETVVLVGASVGVSGWLVGVGETIGVERDGLVGVNVAGTTVSCTPPVGIGESIIAIGVFGGTVPSTGELVGPLIVGRGVTVGSGVSSTTPGVLVGAFSGGAITTTSWVGIAAAISGVGLWVAWACEVARSPASAAAAAGAIGGSWNSTFHGA